MPPRASSRAEVLAMSDLALGSATARFVTAAPARRFDYNEDIVRKFLIASMFWGVVAFFVGCYIAAELAWPQLNIAPWFNFGRLRPVHTSAAIFAFGGSALFGT